MSDAFHFDEIHLSQIPALQLLISLGFEYLSPEKALAARGDKTGQVLLEEVLREQLKAQNRILHKGQTWLFSEENIQSAMQRLKNVKYDGLLKTNEAVYDLLTLGVALEQSIEGDVKSFTLNYLDWRKPVNNVYHVTAEFTVQRTRSYDTARPDIVLLVIGIPYVVIECKSPKVEVAQALSQNIHTQSDAYITRLFNYPRMGRRVTTTARRTPPHDTRARS